MVANSILMKEYSQAIAGFQTGMSNSFQSFVTSAVSQLDDPLGLVDLGDGKFRTQLFLYMERAYPIWQGQNVNGALQLANSFYQVKRANVSLTRDLTSQTVSLAKAIDPSGLTEKLMPHWEATGMVEKTLREALELEIEPFFGEAGKAASGRIGTVVRDATNSLYSADSGFSTAKIITSPGACSYCEEIADSFELSRSKGSYTRLEEVAFHDHCNCIVDWD